ncbi:hypothetical protein M407DRAFT_96138 [Tulasnella calospora MUT 4182]|uniref:Uncharacterized protein n=1 Tax=Tulasnella calospora MUT 4182 TaxID=1051891 RepID=A0A0C3MGL8_9AGAM|nr:hypothetical protein M407DRAFT_96138 [Tulasnella calospora MUT 4182]
MRNRNGNIYTIDGPRFPRTAGSRDNESRRRAGPGSSTPSGTVREYIRLYHSAPGRRQNHLITTTRYLSLFPTSFADMVRRPKPLRGSGIALAITSTALGVSS